jgi:curved DNA-binding protein CbpA
MQDEYTIDHYEALQISPNADPEMIHRIYRLLAQRFHPDNQETGNAERFRLTCDAYAVLSDPAARAKYDVAHQRLRNERWRLVSDGFDTEHDVEMEQAVRLTVLEVLYTRRRTDPRNPGLFPVDLEEMTGTPKEHLEFTMWFLTQKKLIQRADNSRLTITVEGVEYLEQNYKTNGQRRLRLRAAVESLDLQGA